jgi:hypothetical protein
MSRDPLDEMTSRDAGVRELVSALLSAPGEDELSREQVALATFRAFSPARAAQPDGLAQRQRARAPRASRSHRSRVGRTRSFRFGVRLAAVATVITLASGFAVAGYAAALPPSLQRGLHHWFASLGVPDSAENLPTPPPSPSASPGQARGGSRHHQQRTGAPAPVRSRSQPASPSPSPGRHHQHHRQSGRPAPHQHGGLTVAPSAHRIQAGDSVSFAVSLDEHGRPEPGVQLGLLEFPAWAPGRPWQIPGSQTTNAQGRADLSVPFLQANAFFEVTGPGPLRSGKIKIVVIPQVFVSIFPGHGHGHGHGAGQALVFVSSLGAVPGDTVKLEVRGHGGHWNLVSTTQFRYRGHAVFPIDPDRANRTYRAVVLATKLHGRAVSKAVTGPSGGHGHWRWRWWTPPPTPGPTAAPTPSPSPSAPPSGH